VLSNCAFNFNLRRYNEAAQSAAAALGIKLGGGGGGGEKADDARLQNLSPQTMAAMEGLWAAMDDGAIVLLSKAINKLEKASGFEAPERGTAARGSEAASAEAAASLRSLPKLQLWAAVTLHRRQGRTGRLLSPSTLDVPHFPDSK